MARRRKRRRTTDEDSEILELNLSPETKRGISIVVFLAMGIIATLALSGIAGSFGVLSTKLLKLVFGSVAYVAPLLFFGVSLSLFLGVRKRDDDEEPEDEEKTAAMIRTYVGAALFTLAITGILHLFAIESGEATAFELVKQGHGGGYVGIFTSFPLYSIMGFGAGFVVLLALAIISFLVTFNISLHSIFRTIVRFISHPFHSRPEDGEQARRTEPSLKESGPVKINTMHNMGFAMNKVSEAEEEQPEQPDDEYEQDNEAEEEAEKEISMAKTVKKKTDWKLPPADLLEPTSSDVQSGNIEANVKIIQKTLEDFGVVVEMGEVNVGPTVTQYTFRPAVGVKVSQIVNLQNDLALALAAPSLRIEAPIPGKSLVGIEVPNKTSAIVRLRELIESEQLNENDSRLAFSLGRDVAGHPVIADLAKMPHLLIAGATGTGKSVSINTLLTSFLYRNTPDDLRFIIIDPKRVELSLYNNIPHLLTPVVIDHKQAVNALRWMVAEMDRRYKLLSEVGKRNINEYNASHSDKLPFIIVIVDELADLMAVAMSEVEASIVRLAQMARAVGLHLILATQRPSVNIITGLIKANITSRIAFAVASQVDSRTILDQAGAERLLGNGDMLYTSAELPKPKRIQGPYVSEAEVRRVVGFLKDQSGPVEYDDEILEKRKNVAGVPGGDDEEADDDMIRAAIEEIVRAKKASASLLQRRLKVGYARAARILDILEERGLIGPSDGAKPREIYIDEDHSDSV